MKNYRTYSWVAFKKAGLVGVEYTLSLSSLSSDSSSQLDVLGHNRDSLGVDRAQVGVLWINRRRALVSRYLDILRSIFIYI